MKKNKGLAICLAVLMSVSFFSACSNTSKTENTETTKQEKQTSSNDTKKTKITLLSGKPEIATQIEEMAKIFTAENPDIELEIVTGESGKSPYQALTVMYNAGDAPSIFMVEQGDVLKLKDNLLDLSAEQFNKDAISSALAPVTSDGVVYAAPFACESVGFIYNKKAIESATGTAFDPKSIKSTDDLKDVFEKLDKAGTTPVGVSPETWSLGSHYMMYFYANQFPNSEKNIDFTNDLRAGKVDLLDNKVYNGWLDTFDLMKQYNADKADPLASNTDKDAALLAQGKVGFWFMGTFIWPVLEKLGAEPDNFGLMPVPVSNDKSFEGNTELMSLYSMYLAIDKEQNSKEQQEAAKKFLNWLLYSPTGQEQVVSKMMIVPAYTHITLPATNPLNKSLSEYINTKTTNDFNITYPSDHWQVVGGYMQKYLVSPDGRKDLANEIQEYWKTAN